jgi:hypothetical protein
MRFSPAPSSSQFVETHTRVWVVRVSGGTEQQMEVVHPVIEGDELVGFVDGQYQQVPLREVLRVGTR